MEQQMPMGTGRKSSIRYTIFRYFTISALAVIVLIGVILYAQMSQQLTAAVREENQAVLGQINRSVDSYLRYQERGSGEGDGKQPDHAAV